MTTYVPAKKNAEYIFYMGLVSQSTGQFQANPTLAAGDVKVATDDGAPANIGTLPAVDADFTKRVKVTLSASEMNGDNVTVIFSDAAGAEWDDVIVNIQTAANQIDDIIADTNDIQTRLPAALTGDGLMKADTLRVGGTLQTAGDIIGDTNDIQSRLPAALVSGRMDSSVGAMAADTLTASALAADAVTEIQSGLSTLTAAGVRTAVGLASANLDTQLSGIQADTDNIQTRIPAALSGDGFIKADLKSIDDELTNGNNATLNLKQLSVVNDAGAAAIFGATVSGSAVEISAYGTDEIALLVFSAEGDAAAFSGGTGKKSIVATENIQVSDGNLTLAAIASAVWSNATRTLTSFGTLVADIWATAIETGYTAKNSMRLMLSALAGKLSGAATTTVTIRSATDAKSRIVATVDESGNRTAVTHDVSD